MALGGYARGTGCLQVWELRDGDLALVAEREHAAAFRSGSFGASALADRRLATGNFKGGLQVEEALGADACRVGGKFVRVA